MIRFSEDVDLNLISAIGKNMPSVVRGHSTDPVTLEPLLQAYTLDDLYNEGLGFAQYNKYLARMVHQITHRYPHLNILEIGKRCLMSVYLQIILMLMTRRSDGPRNKGSLRYYRKYLLLIYLHR